MKKDIKNLPVTRDFLSGLRALINTTPNVLSLITATRLPLNVLCRGIIADEGSPFYNNFVFHRLQPFRSHEVDQLIERALTDTQVTFDEQESLIRTGLNGRAEIRTQQEAELLKDPARREWVAALQYQHGLATKEAE